MIRTVSRTAFLLAALALAAPAAAVAQIEEPRIPLRTALDELNQFRAEYAETYSKKDAKALAAMYAPDAIFIAPNGAMVVGHEAVSRGLMEGAPQWGHLVIESDTITVYGNTAVDVGTTKEHPSGGGEIVNRYLVVLRRDMKGWKLVRVAITPVM